MEYQMHQNKSSLVICVQEFLFVETSTEDINRDTTDAFSIAALRIQLIFLFSKVIKYALSELHKRSLKLLMNLEDPVP